MVDVEIMKIFRVGLRWHVVKAQRGARIGTMDTFKAVQNVFVLCSKLYLLLTMVMLTCVCKKSNVRILQFFYNTCAEQRLTSKLGFAIAKFIDYVILLLR